MENDSVQNPYPHWKLSTTRKNYLTGILDPRQSKTCLNHASVTGNLADGWWQSRVTYCRPISGLQWIVLQLSDLRYIYRNHNTEEIFRNYQLKTSSKHDLPQRGSYPHNSKVENSFQSGKEECNPNELFLMAHELTSDGNIPEMAKTCKSHRDVFLCIYPQIELAVESDSTWVGLTTW